jgi:DNA-binding FadR family transcriptional regulator
MGILHLGAPLSIADGVRVFGVADGLTVRRIEPAYRQVAAQLRELVLRGELAPGERLPNETELSAMFGVSRSTVREALRVLSSQNLITTTRGVSGGSFVAHPSPDHISEFLEASLGLLSGTEAVSVADLLEARSLLEVPAARRAARQRSDEDVATLRAGVREDLQALERERFEGNFRFHRVIVEASGNRLLEIMARPIFTVLRTRFLRDQAPRDFWVRVADEHRRIFERVEAADADGAAREMAEHLQHLGSTYLAIDRMQRQEP